MPEHPFGWLSLLPPVAAILAAIATRRVVLSLLFGICCGASILHWGDPIGVIVDGAGKFHGLSMDGTGIRSAELTAENAGTAEGSEPDRPNVE